MNDTQNEYSRAVAARCQDIRNQQILPEALVGLAEGVLGLTAQAKEKVRVAMPDRGTLAPVEALFAGSPLVLRAQFPYDEDQALSLMPPLLDLLAATGAEAAKAAEALRRALNPGGGLNGADVLRAYAASDESVFAPWREAHPAAPRALDFVATCALAPSLAAAAELLAPLLPRDLPHEHGSCPLCGSLPYITLLRGKEGCRLGVCSFCGHEYRVRRIACAYCDESDQHKLKLFHVAEYPGVRVDVCDACSMYVKTLDYREFDRDYLPPLDDMATVALDMLAQRNGYSRPVLSAWGF